MNQVKIYDVAGAAGVSLATVSRVLNHPEKVKPETREKIERIIKELGYKPNLNAKGLASSKSTTVAVMVPELSRSSIAEMINGIADCARRCGYLMRLFVFNPPANSSLTPIESEKELWRDVVASGVDGVLYVNDEITDEHLEFITEASKHVVLTNTVCNDPNVPSVSIDYQKAAYQITKTMIERGNKNIWLITSAKKYVANDLKVNGYVEAMEEAGLPPHIIPVSGKTELNEIRYRELLETEKHPDVAIVVRDSMAVSFLNIARTLGIKVPEELQVVGFQNTRYAVLSRPKLTCINTPIYGLGEQAMDLLTNLMENKIEDIGTLQKLIDYNMVWRQTTK